MKLTFLLQPGPGAGESVAYHHDPPLQGVLRQRSSDGPPGIAAATRRRFTLRVPNIMTRVMRWHDFGTGREAGRSEYREYSQGSRQCHGPKVAPAPGWAEGPQPLLWGCSHNGRSPCRAAC